MPLIQDLIKKMQGKEEEPYEELGDIHDRHLEHLERERQFQFNEMRKKQLKQEIAEYKKEKMRKTLYGIGEERSKDEYLGKLQKKKVDIMKGQREILKQQSILKEKPLLNQKSLLNNGKNEFKKTKKFSIL